MRPAPVNRSWTSLPDNHSMIDPFSRLKVDVACSHGCRSSLSRRSVEAQVAPAWARLIIRSLRNLGSSWESLATESPRSRCTADLRRW